MTAAPQILPIEIAKPYLLFVGDVPDNTHAKTATGIAHWCPEDCVGQLRLAGGGADLRLPDMTPAEAVHAGAGTMVMGVASAGGRFPASWAASAVVALEAGLDLASGLHDRLADVPEIAAAAERTGRRILDVRVPPDGLPTGTGKPRPGRRLLTVGTDCAVGKMFTALAIAAEMRARGHDATFRATGQTGIFIAGSGMPIDAVVSDFLSGSVEILCPGNDPAHWDVIEGQGSLFHPAYSAVTLGLVHGSQADALVLCHEHGRTHIEGSGGLEAYALPDFDQAVETYLAAARLTNPRAEMAGIALNTSGLSEADAMAALADAEARSGLSAVDPVRTGVGALIDRIERL